MVNLHPAIKWACVVGSPILLLGGLFVANKQRMNFALRESAESGSASEVAILIERGADVKAKATNRNGDTPLHAAALASVSSPGGVKNNATMKLLVTHGADVNATNDDGDTPLHYAIMMQNPISIRTLIGLGARVDIKSKRFGTPRRQAALELHRDRRRRKLQGQAGDWEQMAQIVLILKSAEKSAKSKYGSTN